MRSWVLLGAVAALALGCATSPEPAVAPEGADIAEPRGEDATPVGEAQKLPPRARTYRIGFWEIDLLALDREPRGTTFRLLDIRILRVLEVGWGEDYHSVSLVEMPDLLNVFTTRQEGITYEHRLADVQALALAPVRILRESRRKSEEHVLKLPIVGDFYGHETDDGVEQWTLLYLFRNEREL